MGREGRAQTTTLIHSEKREMLGKEPEKPRSIHGGKKREEEKEERGADFCVMHKIAAIGLPKKERFVEDVTGIQQARPKVYIP